MYFVQLKSVFIVFFMIFNKNGHHVRVVPTRFEERCGRIRTVGGIWGKTSQSTSYWSSESWEIQFH